MDWRPIRPFFYKRVAPLGIPVRDWYIVGGATLFFFIVPLLLKWTVFGIQLFFPLSIAALFGSISFFAWAHNKHRRGWLEYTAMNLLLKASGHTTGLARTSYGKKRTRWIDSPKHPRDYSWLEK